MSARPALHLVQHLVDDDTGELVGCPHCHEARAESEVWERRVLELERQVKRLTEDKDARLARDKDYTAALALIDEWKTECGHPNAKPDPARIRLALKAIKLYPKEREKLSLVIQHGKYLAWVDPKTGHKKDSFGLLFRDAEQIETRASAYFLWSRRQARSERVA
jgi:hypothetical protein